MLSFFSSNRIHRYLPGIIIAFAVILGIASVWHDSIIVDEDPHIGAGYSYLVRLDMRLNPEHPPLVKDIAALPLLFLNLDQQAFATKFWVSDVNEQWEFGRRLIFNSGNDADTIAHAAKAAVMIFFILGCWIAFRWTRERYGLRAAYIALVLFAFSPTILAHARFVTTDVGALVGVLTATYTFLRYLKNPTRGNLWLAGVVFGLALITKFSTVLLFPCFFIVALLWDGWRTLYKTFLIWIIGFAVIVGPVYFFHTFRYPPARQHSDTQVLLGGFHNRALATHVIWMSDKPVLRAYAEYGLGLLLVMRRAEGGNTVYYRGETLNAAGPGYFPFVYFIKEPLAWWGLVLIAIFGIAMKLKIQMPNVKKIRDHIDEIAMLLFIGIYWYVSIRSTLNIGVRHLLPTYGFAIMLVSGQVSRIVQRVAQSVRNNSLTLHVTRYTILALLIWYVGVNLAIFPHYLTYFNETVGGPRGGHRYVVDSNLDWGQDLRRFADWVEENDIRKIELDYFGWADQSYYLGDHFLWLTGNKYSGEEDFINRNVSDGWMAVSATFLQNQSQTKYAWLKNHSPVTVIGNSIFVYNISDPQF